MTIEAYAKVNLTLEVFGKRPDGFHALRSVVLPVGLSDTLVFTPADDFSTDTGYADDLILKSINRLIEYSNNRMNASSAHNSQLVAFQPYAIHVEKRIPAGGGLGGGSADAAATLLALNELWQLGRTPEELATIGAQIGSDVPALVLANHYRAPVLMEGRGETVELLSATKRVQGPRSKVQGPKSKVQSPKSKVQGPKSKVKSALDLRPWALGFPFSLVLANPGVPCSTAAVYGKCRVRVTDDEKILYTMCTALESQDVRRIAAAMMNDLQEPAVEVCPAVGEALAALREAGIGGAMMSGSGSTVFGLVPTEGEGREIATLLNGRGLRAWSVAACPVV